MNTSIQPQTKTMTTILTITITTLAIIMTTPIATATPIQLDPTTKINDYSYDHKNNTFHIEIHTETTTTITLTDISSAMSTENRITFLDQKTTILEKGTHQITHKATPHNGESIIGISSPTNQVYITEKKTLFTEEPTWSDVQASGLSGIITGLSMITILALRKTRIESKEPKRIL
ncbi:hypothetical protein [Methanonatronarchaeum sp. AMET6-2]|uniref:hypothetical protein n=1 Tax=Methanonatronarchaeum sp. AMET6-2 TaxID=2933293 RepID=UPI0012254C22|nr:hypothetical protein [Methanonatronarchaeum sp. AMET6-2]RZN60858.1 MAG: hypothetical protein EF811_06075 [Methanonatronarchaeia archaeon]UOY09556.1 hypothetical protein MU439_04700 [Methanonatronarchaeum sp. AMET6-2]